MRMHRIATLALAGLFASLAFAEGTGPTHPDSGARSPMDSKDREQGVYPESGISPQDDSPRTPATDLRRKEQGSSSLPGRSGSDDHGPIPSVDEDGARANGS